MRAKRKRWTPKNRKNEPDGSKQCAKCECILPYADFYRSCNGRYGLNGYCKKCHATHHKAYSKAHRVELTKYEYQRREHICSCGQTLGKYQKLCVLCHAQVEYEQSRKCSQCGRVLILWPLVCKKLCPDCFYPQDSLLLAAAKIGLRQTDLVEHSAEFHPKGRKVTRQYVSGCLLGANPCPDWFKEEISCLITEIKQLL